MKDEGEPRFALEASPNGFAPSFEPIPFSFLDGEVGVPDEASPNGATFPNDVSPLPLFVDDGDPNPFTTGGTAEPFGTSNPLFEGGVVPPTLVGNAEVRLLVVENAPFGGPPKPEVGPLCEASASNGLGNGDGDVPKGGD